MAYYLRAKLVMRTLPPIVLAVFLGACGLRLPPVPTTPRDDAIFSPPETFIPPGMPEDRAMPFVLLPGDTVRVQIISMETVDAPGLLVEPDGMVTVPLAGRVHVGGKTPTAAEAAIAEAVRRLDYMAKVIFFVVDTGGHRVTVLGAVERPGIVPLKGDLRLAEVLATVGGPKMRDTDGQLLEVGDFEATRVVRAGKTLPVSLARALEGDPLHNVLLHAGDHVYIPPARGKMITVLGNVKTARMVAAPPGSRLTTILALAGGTTREADEGDIRIVRGPLSKPRVYRASVRDLIAGRAPDVELAPGDIVYVTEHWIATLGDVVQRLTAVLSTASVVSALAR